MSDLIHCIYASAATRSFQLPELTELLAKACASNERLGLTGMLLYAEGSFFQVLEGQAEVVEALYAKIELDNRHDQVTKIIVEPIQQRCFGAWTMGFSKLSRAELAVIPGANDFFGKGHSFTEIDPGRAKKLLASFHEGRWRTKLTGVRQLADA